MTERHRNLVIAFVLAALAVLLMTVYLAGRKAEEARATTRTASTTAR